MNTSINIQRPTTPTSSQSVIIIPDSPQSATPQTQSVAPQSDSPQARSVSRKTQTSSVTHQTQTGPELSEAASLAVDPSLDLREDASQHPTDFNCAGESSTPSERTEGKRHVVGRRNYKFLFRPSDGPSSATPDPSHHSLFHLPIFRISQSNKLGQQGQCL